MYTIEYLYCLLSAVFVFRHSLRHPEGEPCITTQNHVYTYIYIYIYFMLYISTIIATLRKADGFEK